MKAAKIFAVTGPESSGKTYLSQQLATHFELQLIEEFARTYLDLIGRHYVEEDLSVIAGGQYDYLSEKGDLTKAVIMDTDGLTLKIWAEEKFDQVDPLIIDLWKKNLPTAYLLCRPDIPWVDDPQRENPLDRDRLFKIYEKEIINSKVPYLIIEGDYDQRFEMARVYMNTVNS